MRSKGLWCPREHSPASQCPNWVPTTAVNCGVASASANVFLSPTPHFTDMCLSELWSTCFGHFTKPLNSFFKFQNVPTPQLYCSLPYHNAPFALGSPSYVGNVHQYLRFPLCPKKRDHIYILYVYVRFLLA